MSVRVVLLLLLLLLPGACRLPTGAAARTAGVDFSVLAVPGELVLRNRAPERVHYVALEEETAALVDLNFDHTAWPSVAPGREERVPYSGVMGYHREAERVLVHWRTSDDGGVLRVELR